MKVVKRNGDLVNMRFDEITDRIALLCYDLSSIVDPVSITKDVVNRVYDGITTSELDDLTAELCVSYSSVHPDYGVLAGRILINNHQKHVFHDCPTFSSYVNCLYNSKYDDGTDVNFLSKDIYDIVNGPNGFYIDEAIKNDRDFLIDFFGMKTLMKSYLVKVNDKILETAQYMWMRVSLGIHGNDIFRAIDTYNLMSLKYFTHASPTLYNAGSNRPALSSCFLLGTTDCIDGIFKTISDCGRISKWSGGIGVHISCIRAAGSVIRGTNGKSDGIVPMLKVYNDVARYINQGGGKRLGSFAIYLEPWHADVFEFLDCKKNHGSHEVRARDLFYALWVPDLFMKRVESNDVWSLMCPDECPGLADSYGEDFERLYIDYEKKGMYKKRVHARELWEEVINSQIETGTPYISYKDHVNKKCNQKNLGIIKSSNLCNEINIYSDDKEYGTCNLSSIALSSFVKDDLTFDFEKLIKVSRVVAYNLNKVIDINYYPVPEAKLANTKHRPIGIGVQGFANVLMKMRIPYDSKEASDMNIKIFETIYYGALLESVELSKTDGPYSTFKGSPFSEGKLQFDLCEEFDGIPKFESKLGYDWDSLKNEIVEYGVRNSLLTALMPTASTSQILGNYESFEPPTSNLFKRRTLAGEFIVLNDLMVRELISMGLWNNRMKNKIIEDGGSIQYIEDIPQYIKDIYKTSWEIKQKVFVDLSADRSLFVDQSQSLNLYFEVPEFNTLQKAHFYGWKRGLKTGSYYIRSKPSAKALSISNTIDDELEDNTSECISCSA